MLGFVILSHREPDQVRRLIDTLNLLYDHPPIACHHDQSQSFLDVTTFPANVWFVAPSRPTPWAKWAIVEATLAGIDLLYARADPDYFFLISGADYPTACPEQVRADLLAAAADAFVDHFPLQQAFDGPVGPGDAHLAHHRAPHNVKLARDHYLRVQLKLPVVRFRPPAYSTTSERYPRLGRVTLALPLDSPFTPFSPDYRCFVGSQWMTGSRKVARKLLSPSSNDRKLQDFYKSRVIPDESYLQTVLCNDPDLRIDGRSFRFAIWHGAHPIELGVEHHRQIVDSKAHFTRKFSASDPVLDLIDSDLGLIIPDRAQPPLSREITPQHARRQAKR